MWIRKSAGVRDAARGADGQPLAMFATRRLGTKHGGRPMLGLAMSLSGSDWDLQLESSRSPCTMPRRLKVMVVNCARSRIVLG